jgi:Na+/melibiose symporter-like transporter
LDEVDLKSEIRDFEFGLCTLVNLQRKTVLTMRRIGLMTVLFWIGAFVPAAVGVWYDIYGLGRPTPHSTSAFLQLQMTAALGMALFGALFYGVGLSPQKTKSVTVYGMRPLIIAFVSGLVFLVFELWFGIGVPRRSPENTSVGFALVVVVPIALSRLTIWVLSRRHQLD